MRIQIRADSIEVTGYVNAVERNSKPLMSRIGEFIERICKGAFFNALKRNDDVRVLLNHDWNRDLGGTKDGTLELTEDNIGLYARAIITDPEVIEDARAGKLVGWSFGFTDTPDGVDYGVDSETNLPLRKVRDLNLYEVSILNRSKIPAYEGTLIMARSDDELHCISEAYLEEPEVIEERAEEKQEEQQPEQEQTPAAIEIDYSEFDRMIEEMKEGKV